MIQWEWDPVKAEANIRKHGVTFELAATAIDDPFALVSADPHEDGDRWQVIGVPALPPFTVLFVVHTEAVLLNDEWVGRIISARRATAGERRRYEAEGR